MQETCKTPTREESQTQAVLMVDVPKIRHIIVGKIKVIG